MSYGMKVMYLVTTHTHTRTYPELATLFSDHFPVLHHVDRTLVDGVVCFVSQPVLVTLTARDRGGVTSQFTSVPVQKQSGVKNLWFSPV